MSSRVEAKPDLLTKRVSEEAIEVIAAPRPAGPIFEQDWWCEASSPGSWDAIEIDEGGTTVARLVYQCTRRMGLREISPPYLAREMRPFLSLTQAKDVNKLQRKVSLLNALHAKMPRHDRFWYMLAEDAELDLAYSLCGYTAQNAFTFCYDPAACKDPWSAIDRKVRNVLRSGMSDFSVEFHCDHERHARLSKNYISKDGRARDYNDYEAIGRIFEASKARGQAIVISAVNDDAQDAATAVLLWDNKFLY
jgi:hypothetical protein